MTDPSDGASDLARGCEAGVRPRRRQGLAEFASGIPSVLVEGDWLTYAN